MAVLSSFAPSAATAIMPASRPKFSFHISSTKQHGLHPTVPNQGQPQPNHEFCSPFSKRGPSKLSFTFGVPRLLAVASSMNLLMESGVATCHTVERSEQGFAWPSEQTGWGFCQGFVHVKRRSGIGLCFNQCQRALSSNCGADQSRLPEGAVMSAASISALLKPLPARNIGVRYGAIADFC